jgi:hypothetical protein
MIKTHLTPPRRVIEIDIYTIWIIILLSYVIVITLIDLKKLLVCAKQIISAFAYIHRFEISSFPLRWKSVHNKRNSCLRLLQLFGCKAAESYIILNKTHDLQRNNTINLQVVNKNTSLLNTIHIHQVYKSPIWNN